MLGVGEMTISRTLKFDPTPEELAREIAAMNSKEQAQFLNELGFAVTLWTKPASMQWEYMASDLDNYGKELLREWGEYGK